MQVARPVDADADEIVVLFEKLAPFIVQQRAVGLYGIFERHALPGIFVLELDGPPIKIDAHQSWFAALPGDRYLWRAMGLDELPDVGLQNLLLMRNLLSG